MSIEFESYVLKVLSRFYNAIDSGTGKPGAGTACPGGHTPGGGKRPGAGAAGSGVSNRKIEKETKKDIFIIFLVLTTIVLNAILILQRQRRCIMVLNNIELDVKVKCLEAHMNQLNLAEKIGTTGQYVNRIIKRKDGLLNKTFVEIMEALGYDIEFTYVKREE